MELHVPPLLRFPRWPFAVGAVLYMAGIYYLSGLQPIPETDYPFLWAFLANGFHFPLYTGMGALLLLTFRAPPSQRGRIFTPSACFRAFLLLCLYGVFDEIHQSWTDRTPSVIDVLLDLAGGVSALLILKVWLEGSLSWKRFLVTYTALGIVVCLLALLGAWVH